MKQISAKLNTYVSGVSVINNNAEKIILKVILWSFGGLALFYVLILGNMVKDIVERQSLEAEARSLSNEVRDLEVVYLSMSSGVDLAYAYSLGFTETKASFSAPKSLGYKLSAPASGNVRSSQNDF